MSFHSTRFPSVRLKPLGHLSLDGTSVSQIFNQNNLSGLVSQEQLQSICMNIAIDIDEVLAQFLQAVIDYHNNTYNTNLTTDQFHTYHFWDTWGGTRQEAIDKVADFARSDYFPKIKPVEGAQEAIQILNQNHTLTVITARPETMEKETRLWLNTYFPKTFDQIFFTNHWTDECETRSKGDICNLVNADLLIEDNLDYAHDCLNGKRKVLLFNHPWNQSDDLPDSITGVQSWSEALEHIE